MAQLTGNDPQRILFIRWKSIGDVVQTLPAWNALRAAYPRAHITFMTSAENAGLVRLFPAVDAVLAFDRHALFLRRHAGRFAASWRALWQASLGGKFDLVVDLQGYGETAFLTFLSRAKQRWGIVFRTNRAYAYTSPVPRATSGHVADSYLEVLRRNGLPASAQNRLALPAPVLDSARTLLDRLGIKPTADRPLVCIHPLTTGAHKNWPLANYAQVAVHAEQQGFQILVTGGPNDRSALEQSPLARWPIACGQDLPTSCGMVSLAALVVGGDTGLLHAAQAAGSRVLMVMLAEALERSGPYQKPDWAVTAPRLADLTVAKVQAAFDQARPKTISSGRHVPNLAPA